MLGVFVLAKDAGGDELVDQLLHAVESGEEALGGHNDSEGRFGSGSLSFGAGLKGDHVETNHVASEVNLTDSVNVKFFFHFVSHSLSFKDKSRRAPSVESKNGAPLLINSNIAIPPPIDNRKISQVSEESREFYLRSSSCVSMSLM